AAVGRDPRRELGPAGPACRRAGPGAGTREGALCAPYHRGRDAMRSIREDSGPVVEQIVSAGCAAHGLMLAAFAQGLGAFWRTGEAAYDEAVKGALGVGSDDLIIGFIFVGTDTGGAPSRSRPVVQELAHRWAGDGHKSAMP